MSTIRKALGAGLLAALTLIGTAIHEGGVPADGKAWVSLLAAALGAFVAAGVAVYVVPNANTVNGSTPGQS